MPGFLSYNSCAKRHKRELGKFKALQPNGMPINVMQNTSPIAADVIASGSPQNTSHKMFASRETGPATILYFAPEWGKS